MPIDLPVQRSEDGIGRADVVVPARHAVERSRHGGGRIKNGLIHPVGKYKAIAVRQYDDGTFHLLGGGGAVQKENGQAKQQTDHSGKTDGNIQTLHLEQSSIAFATYRRISSRGLRFLGRTVSSAA